MNEGAEASTESKKQQKRTHDLVDKTLSFTSEQQPKKVKIMDEETIRSLIDSKCQPLLQKIQHLVRENELFHEQMSFLEQENNVLLNRFYDLDDDLEELKQYSRRTNIRIFNVAENIHENTNKVVQDIIRFHLGLEIPDYQFGNSHRLGEPSEWKRRPIICQFVSSRVQMDVVERAKQNWWHLKTARQGAITIVEDLTARRAKLVAVGRRYTREGDLLGAWSDRGRVKVRKINRQISIIKRNSDLTTAIKKTPASQGKNTDKHELTPPTSEALNVMETGSVPTSVPSSIPSSTPSSIPSTTPSTPVTSAPAPVMSTPRTESQQAHGLPSTPQMTDHQQMPADLTQHPLPPFTPGITSDMNGQGMTLLQQLMSPANLNLGGHSPVGLVTAARAAGIYEQPPPIFNLPGLIMASKISPVPVTSLMSKVLPSPLNVSPINYVS